MGTEALVMAETINVPYVEMDSAARIPALAYLGSVYCILHPAARAAEPKGWPSDPSPSDRGSCRGRQ
ncbi:hypothetical protein, partial [Pseudomonas aeruginosa]|uniref:hypothetical protein n=1 Tax=Pseudomonas aeruginosa TaxID=287 RepID=UPI00209AFFE9